MKYRYLPIPIVYLIHIDLKEMSRRSILFHLICGFLLYIKSLVNEIYIFSLFQIRQEKPYYLADPEVDSLVSIVCFLFLIV